MSAELEVNNKEVVIYFIYQPSGVLAPVEGKCETFVETYGFNFFSFLFPRPNFSFPFCVLIHVSFYLIFRWRR